MKIKAIITDVDGVLTDGGYYYTADGLAMKKFNTRDAAAVYRLKEAGLKWAIVTCSDDAITKKRMEVMQPDYAWYACEDKLNAVKEIVGEVWGFDLSEIAYIGDDYMDAPALEAVGYPFYPEESNMPNYIEGHYYEVGGGEGVFAAVVDHVLEMNGEGERGK